MKHGVFDYSGQFMHPRCRPGVNFRGRRHADGVRLPGQGFRTAVGPSQDEAGRSVASGPKTPLPCYRSSEKPSACPSWRSLIRRLGSAPHAAINRSIRPLPMPSPRLSSSMWKEPKTATLPHRETSAAASLPADVLPNLADEQFHRRTSLRKPPRSRLQLPRPAAWVRVA